jgi:ADP-heptose:LPS heptosyltransferase
VLHQLLVDSFKNRAETRSVIVISDGDVLPQFDYQCPLMSLPLAFDTQLNSIPAKIPYLFVDKSLTKSWQFRLKNNHKTKAKKINVGLVWAGSTLYSDDINRSIPLALLADILALDAQFHSLQKQVSATEEEAFKALDLQFHHQHLNDFAETAALVNEMDLVITVDTAVAHLAGALGKPVWILLPYIPDFRWLLDREDSPWYPTARLFRQTKAGGWDELIVRVKKALETEFKLS